MSFEYSVRNVSTYNFPSAFHTFLILKSVRNMGSVRLRLLRRAIASLSISGGGIVSDEGKQLCRALQTSSVQFLRSACLASLEK